MKAWPSPLGGLAGKTWSSSAGISRDRNYSEEVAAAIDQEVREIVESSYQRRWKS